MSNGRIEYLMHFGRAIQQYLPLEKNSRSVTPQKNMIGMLEYMAS